MDGADTMKSAQSIQSQGPTPKTGRINTSTRARSWLWLPLSLKVLARTRGLVSPTQWMKMLSLLPRPRPSRGLQLALGSGVIFMTYLRINGSHTTIVPVISPNHLNYLTGLFQRKPAKDAKP